MVLPCEIAAKKVSLIKAKLARELLKRGLSQKEIAKELDVTEAAVSQYLSGKRAKKQISGKPKRIACVCEICGACR